MQIYSDISTLSDSQITRPTVLTIGNFDGIHRGHQVLLDELQRVAAQLDAASGMLIFDPHPLTVLRPTQPHLLLTIPHERLHLAAALGIDIGIIQPFTHELMALEPATFMEMLVMRLKLRALVVGPDFALGRNRSGNLEVLAALGKKLGYSLHVIEPVALENHSVRSSAIRTLLSDGDVATAAALLGRAYHATGLVIHGDQRGRQIGIPTANLQIPENKLWPADGVYATRTYLHDVGNNYDAGNNKVDSSPLFNSVFNSVTNLGMRPTVGGTEHRFETHLLDFPHPGGDDNLYGQTVTVEFVARLRGEKRFNGLTELVTQIHADIAQARELLPVPLPQAHAFFLKTP
jgi:riboflavin kinase/FMN adenylyltransferase